MSWLDILADRQKADEDKVKEFDQRIEILKQGLKDAVDNNDFVKAQKFLNAINGEEEEKEEFENSLYRSCYKCGATLRPP